jgi:fibronectin type 3 domain-containing protein
MSKKKDKRIAHAEMVWEREQVQAATAMQQIDKAQAIIELNKDELTEEQLAEVYRVIENRREDVKAFLLAARDKYVTKMDEYNLEVVIAERAGLDLSEARPTTLELS